MKRRVIQLVLLLVAGAMVNVAVAWGCANGFVWPPKQRLTNYDTTKMWSRVSEKNWPASPRGLDRRERFGCRFDETAIAQTTRLADGGLDRRGFVAQEVSAGWPALALSGNRGERFNDKTDRESIEHGFIHLTNGIGWLNVDPDQVFPIRPIWPGFAINTIFYAAILWLVFAVPLALRRRRRIKRGLCPACAYDLRGRAAGSQMCPECGTLLP